MPLSNSPLGDSGRTHTQTAQIIRPFRTRHPYSTQP